MHTDSQGNIKTKAAHWLLIIASRSLSPELSSAIQRTGGFAGKGSNSRTPQDPIRGKRVQYRKCMKISGPPKACTKCTFDTPTDSSLLFVSWGQQYGGALRSQQQFKLYHQDDSCDSGVGSHFECPPPIQKYPSLSQYFTYNMTRLDHGVLSSSRVVPAQVLGTSLCDRSTREVACS